MNFTLKRTIHSAQGIFGSLSSDDGFTLVTLEHAFATGDSFAPAIPDGTYTCQRGMHQLLHMARPFETFQVMNVPGHTDILLHPGDYNRDSEGCILLGKTLVTPGAGTWAIYESRIAFWQFMNLLKGVNQFQLSVIS